MASDARRTGQPASEDEAPTADRRDRTRGLLRSFVSDYKGIASLVGLLVYGVVRVSYDAYYTRLGVFPEAVGLTEVTILGRAALYLALTASIAAIFGGLWYVAVRWGVDLAGEKRATWLTPARLLAFAAVPAAAVVALVVVPGAMRSFLESHDFARYCIARCKLAVQDSGTLDGLDQLVRNHGASHPSWAVTRLGSAWLVVGPLAFLFAAAALAPLLRRGRRAHVAVFCFLATASLTAGFVAPHLASALHDSLSRSGGFVEWTIFVLLIVGIGGGLVAVLRGLVESPADSPWTVAAFVAVVPVVLGFFEPDVPRFIEDEGASAAAVAVLLWLALVAASFELWPSLRTRGLHFTPRLVVIAALVVSSTLFLAWERGLNLAEQAAMGDQILPRRFDLLSVRAAVVCLDPTTAGTRLGVPRRPYTYLGQAEGTLILYDFVADIAHDTPTAFPLRVPAGSVVVRLAKYAPGKLPYWNCSPN